MIDARSRTTNGMSMRRTVAIVAALNFAYFFVEYAAAVAIGSVSLFADSVDFLEDASVNILVLIAFGWTAVRRKWTGVFLAGVILVPGIAALWTAWEKFAAPVAPEPFILTITGLGALAVNATCALLLTKVRTHGGSLTRAAYLAARNDVLSNVAIIAAGLLTFATMSAWPDLIVGVGIAILNAGAALEVFQAAMGEVDDDDEAGRAKA